MTCTSIVCLILKSFCSTSSNTKGNVLAIASFVAATSCFFEIYNFLAFVTITNSSFLTVLPLK